MLECNQENWLYCTNSSLAGKCSGKKVIERTKLSFWYDFSVEVPSHNARTF